MTVEVTVVLITSITLNYVMILEWIIRSLSLIPLAFFCSIQASNKV